MAKPTHASDALLVALIPARFAMWRRWRWSQRLLLHALWIVFAVVMKAQGFR
jgi:hypothetical protein